MTETVEGLQPLLRRLPELQAAPEIAEDGERFYRGFQGDQSLSPLYVTDGHILLLVSAIDQAIAVRRDADAWSKKLAIESRIEVPWKAAEQRVDVAACFIGACKYHSLDEVAFLRDTQGRVMTVNAHLLAFGVNAVHPDALSVSAAPLSQSRVLGSFVPIFDTPLALRRDGKLVGLVMPMRMTEQDFSQYDMTGDPVDLAAKAGE